MARPRATCRPAHRLASATDHRRLRRRARVPVRAYTILVCALAAPGWVETAAGDTMRIEVGADQTASIDGQSDSLKSVVAELCERAGVRLIGYEASDRPVAAHYGGIPLKDLLTRLLKRESYVVGLRTAGSASKPRVSTLRVIGDKTGDSTYAVLPPDQRTALSDTLSGGGVLQRRTTGFEIPAEILSSAFRSDSPSVHAEAARYISEDLLADAKSQQLFLAAESETIASALRPYGHSAGILTLVRNQQESAAMIAKLDEIIAAVRREADE